MTRLTRAALRRPKTTIALWAVVVALCFPFALQLEHELKAGGFSNPRGDGTVGQTVLEEAFGEPPNSLQVVLRGEPEAIPDAVAAVREVAADLPHVVVVQDASTQPAWLSGDGRTTFVQIGFDADSTTTQNLVEGVREDLAAAVDPAVTVHVTGAPALDLDLNVQSQRDAVRAELIAFPVLIVVLLLVFRSVVAAAVPLAMAGVALVITQAVGYAVARVTDLSILFTNGMMLIGLAVAVDYSLFIIRRYREEEQDGAALPEALGRSMGTAGHSVLFGGLAVVVALAALFIPQIMVFSSLALAGIVVTSVALAISMTLLPAVLHLLGPRLWWKALPTRPARRREALGVATRRPLVALLLTVGVLGALALPMTGIRLQVPVASAEILPASADARQGIEVLGAELDAESLFPVQVVLVAESGDAAALLEATGRASEVAASRGEAERVVDVTTLGLPPEALEAALLAGAPLPEEAQAAVAGLWTADPTLVSRVVVVPAEGPDTTATHDLVAALRADVPGAVPDGVRVYVSGATAQGADFDAVVETSLPVIVLFVSIATIALLTWAFRSWRLPLLALALNGLVVAASLGILTLVFQDWLGVPVNSVTPLLLFAIMFGLSMDYMVIMISRMREHYLAHGDHTAAIQEGLRRTAGLVNSAAIIMVAVFASFGTAQISVVRQLGLGLATAVILDAVVVRLVLMPAALSLLGPKVWGVRRPGRHGSVGAPGGDGTTTAPASASAGTPALVAAGAEEPVR